MTQGNAVPAETDTFETAPRAGAKPSTKAAGAFRTISEVADDLGVPQHVLRFWETRFFQVRPLKRGGGRRYYRPEDVALIKKIHHLLYSEGYTIKGVQKLLKGMSKTQLLVEQGMATPAPAVTEAKPFMVGEPANETTAQVQKPGLNPQDRATLKDALAELKELRELLKAA